MANSPIDINAMAASIYQTIMSIQKSAEEVVGLDVLWCRAIPYANSEDVIVQEYTLSNVECPQPLRVIQDKSDYQPGTYSMDLFGMSYENPLEISINIDSWKQIYGNNSVPQKGDIVLIKIYNRLYEVASMTIQYMLQSKPQYYKCTLTKYQRKASRKEPDEIRVSIDELTNAQDTLFGNAIANEVADAVVERETSYNQTSYIDPICDCDLNSIITQDVYGPSGNLFATAFYDFNIAAKNPVYKNIEASYNLNDDDINTHWIYTCWFRFGHNSTINSSESINDNQVIIDEQTKLNDEKPVTIELYNKDKNYYRFKYTTALNLKENEPVILYRGTLFSFSGIIEKADCTAGKVIAIPTSDVLLASKKANKWWETIKSGWKIKKAIINSNSSINNDKTNTANNQQHSYNIFSAYSGINKNINFNITTNNIILNFGNVKKTITLKKNLVKNNWYYICIDVNLSQIDIKLIETQYNEKTFEISEKIILNKIYTCSNIKGFMIDSASIENIGLDFNICNIRLYESEYGMENKYKLDMYSEITRNASKLILIDNPLPANKMKFVSALK